MDALHRIRFGLLEIVGQARALALADRLGGAPRATAARVDVASVDTAALRALGAFAVVGAAGPYRPGAHGLARTDWRGRPSQQARTTWTSPMGVPTLPGSLRRWTAWQLRLGSWRSLGAAARRPCPAPCWTT